jgi:hypothetical protein
MKNLNLFLYFSPLLFVIYFFIKKNNKLKNIYKSDVSFDEGAEIIRNELDSISGAGEGNFEVSDLIGSDINSEHDDKRFKSKYDGDTYLYSIIFLFFRKYKVFGFLATSLFVLLLLMQIVF